jgi:polar amino acid transport system substrate-binding protein
MPETMHGKGPQREGNVVKKSIHNSACAALIAIAWSVAASAQTPDPSQKGNSVSTVPADVVKDLAPTGKLRAAINLGNTVLAQGTPQEPRGITVDLARELSKRLGVPLEMTTYDAAGKVFEALKGGTWDIAFLAIEPVRAAEIAFTAPYVIIEGNYMVPEASPLKTVADVDRDGVRIAVAKGSAYDLFLSRTLKNAKLVRSQNGPEAMNMFVADKLEAAAGVKQPIVAFAKSHPGLRVIEQRFMAIEQAMGTPRARYQGREAAPRYLAAFVEEMKASGFVADALKRSNQPDAAVAPPAGKS